MQKGNYNKIVNNLIKKGILKNSNDICSIDSIAVKIFMSLTPAERNYLIYHRDLQKIRDVYLKYGDWNKIFDEDYNVDDILDMAEPFMDYVEEVYNVNIEDANHLKELTGITKLTIKELNKIIMTSRHTKYLNDIYIAIEDGAKYKDLLKIEPKDYGLPEKWTGQITKDKKSAIMFVIHSEFSVEVCNNLLLYPSLREIANYLEAPLSFIIDCFKKYKY